MRTRLPAEAEPVRRQIRAWREAKYHGSAMPLELWQAAASLAREHGIYTIARGLAVDYGALKQRVQRSTEEEPDDVVGLPGFVELDGVQLSRNVELDGVQLSRNAEPAGPVVELARPDGTLMLIRLPAGSLLDVPGLAAAFCGGGA